MPTQDHAQRSITLDYADPRRTGGRHGEAPQIDMSHQPDGRQDRRPFTNEALGWLSLGLGAAELAAPRLLARVIGIPGKHRLVLRLLGLREIASGLGILSGLRSGFWVRSRVWGDMMDLALLGAVFASRRANRPQVFAAAAAVAGVTWLDLLASRQANATRPATMRGRIHLVKAITVDRSTDDLYRFWRDFQNLPAVIPHLKSVEVMSEARSHWMATAPGGINIEWDAEIVEDQPGDTIRWCSLEGAEVKTAGSVQFTRATGNRGTVIRLELAYDPPAGRIGWLIATLLGRDPGAELQEGLRRFKQHMETGEIVTTEGQPAGTQAW
jgi:uncharacterized membrane protein